MDYSGPAGFASAEATAGIAAGRPAGSGVICGNPSHLLFALLQLSRINCRCGLYRAIHHSIRTTGKLQHLCRPLSRMIALSAHLCPEQKNLIWFLVFCPFHYFADDTAFYPHFHYRRCRTPSARRTSHRGSSRRRGSQRRSLWSGRATPASAPSRTRRCCRTART